jgi:hypothetical protein
LPGLYNLGIPTAPAKKRRVFFSFHYADIMRVNNVRISWEFISPPTTASILYGGGETALGFFDASLWESRKLDGPDALKRLIRDGVDNTSVVCVLVGTKTWQRRWVRYEIARSVIDGKGLLSVHINSIKHHQPPYLPHGRGDNPIRYLGIARKKNGNFYLCERKQIEGAYQWAWYEDHTDPVDVPAYMP